MPYWACMPASSGAPKWSLDNCRIEKAPTAKEALDLAFGRIQMLKKEYEYLNAGTWLVKNMGNSVSVIRSDKQRIALLRDHKNWVDPYSSTT